MSLRACVIGILVLLSSQTASAALVTWEFTDTDGADNGITADLMIGTFTVGTASITRSDVALFGAPTWSSHPSGVLVWETGQATSNQHTARYRVVLESLNPGWVFEGFGLSQYGDSGQLLAQADPVYELIFNTGTSGVATVSEGGGIDFFSNASDGQMVGSGTTLTANGEVIGNANRQIPTASANQWTIGFDAIITDFTVNFSTDLAVGGEVNNESLFFFANVTSAPEPASTALLALGIGCSCLPIGWRKWRARKRQASS